MPPLKLLTFSRAEVLAGSVNATEPLTVSRLIRPPGCRPALRTPNVPDTDSALSRRTLARSSEMPPDTVFAETSPPLPPLTVIPPLTVVVSSREVRNCERIAPLTVVSSASPARPLAVMLPLTVLDCRRPRSTSATSTPALTVLVCSCAARGTRSSSTAPRLLRPCG